MPIPTIVQKDDPVLRQVAKPVTDDMFGSKKLAKIISDMSEALESQDDGVAIAAPQIGVSLRIFVVSGRAFEIINETDEESESSNTNLTENEKYSDMVFINPKIIKISREKQEMEEGCLSVRYLYGKTRRATKARVKAQDIDGKTFEIGGSGLLAQIFQHEIDHLDGKLFIDIATNVHDLPPKK